MFRRPVTLLPLFALAFLSMAASGNACTAEKSSVVDQSRVFTAYWLLHDENANVTSARAQFRLSHGLGTTLELEAPATVSFNGKPLAWNGFWQWHEAQFTGLPDGGAFTYVDTKGNTFVNAAEISRRIDFPADFPAQLDRSQGFTFNWVGPPLAAGEDIELVVSNVSEPTDFVRVDQFSTGATSITVSANQLARVGGTSAKVELRRHSFDDSIDSPDAGGRVQLTWETKHRISALK